MCKVNQLMINFDDYYDLPGEQKCLMCVPENHAFDYAAPLQTECTQPSKETLARSFPHPTPKGLGERMQITHKALFFSARELMLDSEIFSEHLNQNVSGLMCLLECRSVPTQQVWGRDKIFNKLPDDTDATGPQTTLSKEGLKYNMGLT